jgi:phage protein D
MFMAGKNGSQNLVPAFRVQVNGSDLPLHATTDLVALTVEDDVTALGMFTLQLVNWDMSKLAVTWSDDDLFAEGNEVEIQMGYVDSLETLMVGDITGLEPEFCADDMPILIVRGHDRRHRLLRGRQTRSFVQMKDSDIAQQVARAAGLRAQVQDSRVILDYVLQHNQTDLEFLQERAMSIGYEVVVEDKTLHFRAQQHTKQAALVLSLDMGLLEFYPRSSTLTQVGRVEVRGWNPKEKTAIVSQASAGQESTRMGGSTSGPQAANKAFGKTSSANVTRPIFSQAEADQIALGCFNDMALAHISGEGLCVGRADLRAGRVIKIEGLGERFSGLYYVISTTHSYVPAHGYRTAFTVRRNAT